MEAACDMSGSKPASCCTNEISEWTDLTEQIEAVIDADLLDAYIDELIYLNSEADGDAYRVDLLSIVCPLDTETETGFVDPISLEEACNEDTE